MVVRPILTYGEIASGDRARLSTTKAKLHKLQRMACVCMTGAMRTCPTAVLERLMEQEMTATSQGRMLKP